MPGLRAQGALNESGFLTGKSLTLPTNKIEPKVGGRYKHGNATYILTYGHKAGYQCLIDLKTGQHRGNMYSADNMRAFLNNGNWTIAE